MYSIEIKMLLVNLSLSQAECPKSEMRACPLKIFTSVVFWPVKSVESRILAPFLETKTHQTLTDI